MLINAIYGKNDCWKQYPPQLRTTGHIWEDIDGMCDAFLQYTRLEVGKGSMIKFWTDF